jgi:hypothetical protein
LLGCAELAEIADARSIQTGLKIANPLSASDSLAILSVKLGLVAFTDTGDTVLKVPVAIGSDDFPLLVGI